MLTVGRLVLSDPGYQTTRVGSVAVLNMGNRPLLAPEVPNHVNVPELGSVNVTAEGYTGLVVVVDQSLPAYTVFKTGAICVSMRLATPGSTVSKSSAWVTLTTWSLKDVEGPVVANVASAGEVAFSHSR